MAVTTTSHFLSLPFLVIFQQAKGKVYSYAEKKGHDAATLIAIRKFEEGAEDLLQRELRVAECDAMLAVVEASKAAKTTLLQGIALHPCVVWDI